MKVPTSTIKKVSNRDKTSQYLIDKSNILEKNFASQKKYNEFRTNIILCFQQNPELNNCDYNSILNSVTMASQLGLSPSLVFQECFLIPYKNNCTFQMGYKGYISLLLETGLVSEIFAVEVYRGEEFSVEMGLNRNIKHIRKIELVTEDENDIIAFYAVVKFKDGTSIFDVMSKQSVDKRREVAKTANIWNKWFVEMGKKTVIKRLAKNYTRLKLVAQASYYEDEQPPIFENDDKLSDFQKAKIITPTHKKLTSEIIEIEQPPIENHNSEVTNNVNTDILF